MTRMVCDGAIWERRWDSFSFLLQSTHILEVLRAFRSLAGHSAALRAESWCMTSCSVQLWCWLIGCWEPLLGESLYLQLTLWWSARGLQPGPLVLAFLPSVGNSSATNLTQQREILPPSDYSQLKNTHRQLCFFVFYLSRALFSNHVPEGWQTKEKTHIIQIVWITTLFQTINLSCVLYF